LRVPDWLPALVNAGRAFVAVGAVMLFWIVTAWPNGALAITFAAIILTLLAPRGDQAYGAAIGFMVGTCLAVVFAAIMKLALLPSLQTETFLAFSLVIGLYLVPAGALTAQPWRTVIFAAMTANFIPALAPTNPMSYDAAQFYNAASAIVAGTVAGAMSFRLLPPLSPAFRTGRLLALSLRDLRRLATGRSYRDWEGHIRGRLSAIPEQATPLQRSQLMAALAVGSEIIALRESVRRLGLGTVLETALAAVAQGRSMIAIAGLARLDAALATASPESQTVLHARAGILTVSEALTEHGSFFDGEVPG
jgi:uncharacterized membrane protein YccC